MSASRQPQKASASGSLRCRERFAALEAERIEGAEARTRESLAAYKAELGGLARVEYRARAELAVAEHLIAERERRVLAAIRLSLPAYTQGS